MAVGGVGPNDGVGGKPDSTENNPASQTLSQIPAGPLDRWQVGEEPGGIPRTLRGLPLGVLQGSVNARVLPGSLPPV